MASIELRELTFAYPGAQQPVIDGLNLSISAGEAHALLGASGSGKTTLLNLLSGLLLPTSGTILFDSHPVQDLNPHQRRVAQVFQFPVLYDSLSVNDNIMFAIDKTQANAASRVERIMEALGLSEFRRNKPAQLSLYQKQLCAVAKALANPQVSLILLDEPLTAVEPAAKARLREVLTEAQSEFSTTMIYVTHDQTEALTFAERVSVMTSEGILQSASPDEIYHQPAHEYVGYFVGSPGMNFIDSTAGERIGFRPEWCTLTDAGELEVRVESCRFEGTQGGIAHGLVELHTPSGTLFYRGPIHNLHAGDRRSLHIDRGLRYANRQLIGTL